jgi:TolB-like protein
MQVFESTCAPEDTPLAAPTPFASPQPCLRLVLCGVMEAWTVASVNVLPRSRKARALLAILGLAKGAQVARLRLAELLWSRRGEEQRRGSLRQALHELQEALGPVGISLIEAKRDSLRLQAEHVWVDALAPSVTPAGPHLLAGRIEDALLTDLRGLDPAFDAWLEEQRQRMRDSASDTASRKSAIAPKLAGADLIRTAAWQGLAEATPQSFGRYSATNDAPPRSIGAGPTAAAQPGLRGARLGVAALRALGPETEPYLSVGMAEEITLSLAKFRWLFVVDHSSLARATEQRGEDAAANEAGIDLLLGGTVQRLGARVRFSLSLTDLRPPTGIAWTGRFERASNDLLTLQDEIAAEVVARIDQEILTIEAGRAGRRASFNPSAYDLFLRAIPAIQHLDRESFLEAGDRLRAATDLEPDFAAAYAWQAYWGLLLIGQGWARDKKAAAMTTERDARRAVALDPLDAQALTILGHVLAFVHHRPEDALSLHERALSLNPNLSMAWVFAGFAECYLGRHEEALRRLDRYAQLAPCHPHAFFFEAARSLPLLCLGHYEAAADVCRRAIALHDGLSYPYKPLIVALAHLGRTAEARAMCERLLAIEPDFGIAEAMRRFPLQRAQDRNLYEAGLRRSGLR